MGGAHNRILTNYKANSRALIALKCIDLSQGCSVLSASMHLAGDMRKISAPSCLFMVIHLVCFRDKSTQLFRLVERGYI